VEAGAIIWPIVIVVSGLWFVVGKKKHGRCCGLWCRGFKNCGYEKDKDVK